MKTLSALLSAGLTLSMLPSVVNATEYYRVEVMLFTYLDENSAREEHWPLYEQETLGESRPLFGKPSRWDHDRWPRDTAALQLQEVAAC